MLGAKAGNMYFPCSDQRLQQFSHAREVARVFPEPLLLGMAVLVTLGTLGLGGRLQGDKAEDSAAGLPP